MKRIVFVALSLLLLSTFITLGCGNRANQIAIMTITESDWGGNPLPPEEESPSPTITTQEVTRGDEIWLEFGTSQNGPATIREIRDDHVIVRFRTNGIEPVDENGGRTVITERTWAATIPYGETYTVSTSTASSGKRWTFRFEKQDESVNKSKIQMMIDDLLSGELTDDEFVKLSNELTYEEVDQLIDDLYKQLGAEEAKSLLDRLFGEIPSLSAEETAIFWEEYEKTNVEYIIRGNYTPAAEDVDLNTIERVVFYDSFGISGGYGLVIDRMYGRVYYNSEFSSVEMLEFIPFSADFIEEDITRLIQIIDETNLIDWDVDYSSGVDENVEDGQRAWMIGILFSDGTMLRRSGGGMSYLEASSSPEEFAILTDFIKTMGAEIEERHQANERDMDLNQIAQFEFWYETSSRVDNLIWSLGYKMTINQEDGQVDYLEWIRSRDRDDTRFETQEQEMKTFSVEFTDRGFENLKDTIEQSGLLYWDRTYYGSMLALGEFNRRSWEDGYFGDAMTEAMRNSPDGRRDRQWILKITFNDGSVLTREGREASNDGAPPQEEFQELIGFIYRLGKEVETRHGS